MRLALEPDLLMVGEATSEQQMLALAPAVQPDAVVMSVNTPEITGKAIRNLLEQLPTCAVVVLSLHDSRKMREQALAGGATAFVSKHEPIDVLLFTIRRLVGAAHDKQAK